MEQYSGAPVILGAALLAFGAAPACGDASPKGLYGAARGALTAGCFQADAAVLPLPPGAWRCPDPRRVECTAEESVLDEVIFVEPPSPGTCADLQLRVDRGPFSVGTHDIVVRDTLPDGAVTEICRAELTVVDTTTPVVSRRDIALWPPNHEMRALDVADCITVTDSCDPHPSARFLWATSDEAADARGAGNKGPDARFTSCTTVELRQERSGTGDGRVYELGWLVTDHSGNAIQGVCRVTVAHDQGGSAAGQGSAASRVMAPPCGP